MSLLLKGILIGLLFGVPVGAVGAMTVQRTWEHGIKAGLLTGMGSSIADCIYAAIGAFGLTMVSDLSIWQGGPLSCLWESACFSEKGRRPKFRQCREGRGCFFLLLR